MASRASLGFNVVRKADRLTWVTTAIVQAITQSCSSAGDAKPRSFYFNGGNTRNHTRNSVFDLID